MLTVKGRASVRGHIERALRLSARGINGSQFVPDRNPDLLAVIADSMDVVGTRKRSVLAHDLGGYSIHVSNLIDRQRGWE